MRAVATEEFLGVRDGEVMPVLIKEGEEITGDLAATAVKHKQATAVEPEEDSGLNTLTVPQLKELAAERGIDLGDATKKADIIAAIELAEEDKA